MEVSAEGVGVGVVDNMPAEEAASMADEICIAALATAAVEEWSSMK